MRPTPQRKPSVGLFGQSGRPSEPRKPRVEHQRQLDPPEARETPPDAPVGEPDDNALPETFRLNRRHRERITALQKRLAPGVRLSRSAVIRWLLDHWPD